jgi:hypothetical protein
MSCVLHNDLFLCALELFLSLLLFDLFIWLLVCLFAFDLMFHLLVRSPNNSIFH